MRALVALLVACSVAGASPPDRERALQLKEEGAAALERGDAALALGRFEEAYRVFPSAKMLYNVGLAQERLGRDAEAVDSFAAFLAGTDEAPAGARMHALEEIARLAPRLGALTLVASVDGAVLSVDGKPVGSAPLARAVHVSPGPHEAVARHAGHEDARATVELGAGEVRTLHLRLSRLPSPAIAPPPPRPPLVRRWWLWTVVGAVAAGAAIGLGVGLGTRPPETPASTLGTVTPKF